MTPYTSEDAINREGFLSAILAVKVGSPSGTPTGLAVKLTITEATSRQRLCPVKDKLVCVGNAPLDAAGAISVSTDAEGAAKLVNFDLDLVGLKQYVKVKVEMVCTGGSSPSCTATAALALGDASEVPV